MKDDKCWIHVYVSPIMVYQDWSDIMSFVLMISLKTCMQQGRSGMFKSLLITT